MLQRNELPALVERIRSALAFLTTEGYTLSVGRVTFDPGRNVTVPINLAVVQDGVTLTPQATAYEQFARNYGLDPAWLNQEFTMNGKRARIVGLNTRARGYPVLVEHGGKTYRYPAGTIRAFVQLSQAK